jgi:hypothetical protein
VKLLIWIAFAVCLFVIKLESTNAWMGSGVVVFVGRRGGSRGEVRGEWLVVGGAVR